MSFSVSVERLIERWQHDGLIDADTASRLNADLEKRGPRFSLGSVLATLGGLLLGAAVIMLVAANWQDMPAHHAYRSYLRIDLGVLYRRCMA